MPDRKTGLLAEIPGSPDGSEWTLSQLDPVAWNGRGHMLYGQSAQSAHHDNTRRAGFALTAVPAYMAQAGMEEGTVICDLIGDLRHLCDAPGLDFGEESSRAASHYDPESTSDPYEGPTVSCEETIDQHLDDAPADLLNLIEIDTEQSRSGSVYEYVAGCEVIVTVKLVLSEGGPARHLLVQVEQSAHCVLTVDFHWLDWRDSPWRSVEPGPRLWRVGECHAETVDWS